MSHFSVIVVTDNGTEQELEAALAPFHEFECTGDDNQYVQDIDVLEEHRKEWETTEVSALKGADGTIYSPFKLPPHFYRDPTPEERKEWEENKGPFRRVSFEYIEENGSFRVKAIPEDVVEVKVPTKVRETAEGVSFGDWLTDWHGLSPVPFGEEPDLEDDHKYGYFTVDAAGEVVKAVNRTNPNKQWDWWCLGGRWRGRLELKAGETGTSGSMGVPETIAVKNGEEPYDVPGVDSARKGAIDFEKMRQTAINDRIVVLNKVYGDIRKKTGLSDEAITVRWASYSGRIQGLRDAWKVDGGGKTFFDFIKDDPIISQAREDGIHKIGDNWFGAGVPENEPDPWAWAEKAPALTAWAFLGADGVWREKGSMGWFGASTGEATDDDWYGEIGRLLEGVRDDQFITIVDCHI